MSEIAVRVVDWMGHEMAAAALASALVVVFGLVVYGGTRAVLWVGMAAYRASRCLSRDGFAYRASRCLRREGFQRAGLRHEPGKPAAGGADRV